MTSIQTVYFIDKPKERDTAVSAVRFLSMLMIITCHFMQYLNIELAWWFNVGVQIFFTISGFLYGRKTVNNPIKFYKKSFKRVYPKFCVNSKSWCKIEQKLLFWGVSPLSTL